MSKNKTLMFVFELNNSIDTKLIHKKLYTLKPTKLLLFKTIIIVKHHNLIQTRKSTN